MPRRNLRYIDIWCVCGSITEPKNTVFFSNERCVCPLSKPQSIYPTNLEVKCVCNFVNTSSFLQFDSNWSLRSLCRNRGLLRFAQVWGCKRKTEIRESGWRALRARQLLNAKLRHQVRDGAVPLIDGSISDEAMKRIINLDESPQTEHQNLHRLPCPGQSKPDVNDRDDGIHKFLEQPTLDETPVKKPHQRQEQYLKEVIEHQKKVIEEMKKLPISIALTGAFTLPVGAMVNLLSTYCVFLDSSWILEQRPAWSLWPFGTCSKPQSPNHHRRRRNVEKILRYQLSTCTQTPVLF